MFLKHIYWDPGLFGAALEWPLNPLKWMSLSEGTWLALVKLSPKSVHFLAQRAKTANISGLSAGVWHRVTGTKDAHWEAWCPAPDPAPQASWMPPKVAPPGSTTSPPLLLCHCTSAASHALTPIKQSTVPPPQYSHIHHPVNMQVSPTIILDSFSDLCKSKTMVSPLNTISLNQLWTEN